MPPSDLDLERLRAIPYGSVATDIQYRYYICAHGKHDGEGPSDHLFKVARPRTGAKPRLTEANNQLRSIRDAETSVRTVFS